MKYVEIVYVRTLILMCGCTVMPYCSMSKVSKTVTIEPEQAEWLDERDGVNLSGLVRDTIERQMEMEEEMKQDPERTI